MDFPSEEILLKAEAGDPASIDDLDTRGFLIRPGEEASAFAARIRSMHRHCEFFREKTLDGRSFEIYDSISVSGRDAIPLSVMEEASQRTNALYGFSVSWVPGYFISQGLGFLWGGCALSEDEPDSVPVFIIRSAFRTREKWFIYSRTELLSHELCHAARAPLLDPSYEEHFAYATSSSSLRRVTGNCFQRDLDAMLFLLPVFLLLGVQIAINVFNVPMPSWPFWIIAFAWPFFLLIRNFLQRRVYFQAEKKIASCGFDTPGKVLFRCTGEEIRSFARMRKQELEKFFDSPPDLRFRVIARKFRTIEKGTVHVQD